MKVHLGYVRLESMHKPFILAMCQCQHVVRMLPLPPTPPKHLALQPCLLFKRAKFIKRYHIDSMKQRPGQIGPLEMYSNS